MDSNKDSEKKAPDDHGLALVLALAALAAHEADLPFFTFRLFDPQSARGKLQVSNSQNKEKPKAKSRAFFAFFFLRFLRRLFFQREAFSPVDGSQNTTNARRHPRMLLHRAREAPLAPLHAHTTLI